jgi:hypothetical protein
MDARTDHLDLLADHAFATIPALCGGAVRGKLSEREALKVCGIKPSIVCVGDWPSWTLADHNYAARLLDDLPAHVAARWKALRAIERRVLATSPPVYDDEDFEA